MKLNYPLFTAAYALSGLLTAFLIGWLLLAQANFLYGFWHDQVGIGEGIEQYGPQNRYRKGFADTSREERIRLFAAINEAIHSGGGGLADIQYHSESQPGPTRLLRPPEIGHLQDVAKLISVLKWGGAVVFLIWLGLSAWILLGRQPLPPLKQQLAGIGSLLLVTGALVLIIGPETVFNQLHIWIFPPDHPWFFYYQDSLMSTMMLAPRLFGWITVVWVPLAVVCFFGLYGGVMLASRVRRG